MKDPAPTPVLRRDYAPSPFQIEDVDLRFDLDPQATHVRARLAVHRAAGEDASTPLVLDGEHLKTLEVRVDGRVLGADEFDETPTTLSIKGLGSSASVETLVEICPEENAALEGLYRSSGNFCTQCEAEGFRRITWFLDRPDIMSRYSVELVAPRALCPVMLSNGNLVREVTLDDGRRLARWEDPFPKPCYLFALVAGDLRAIRDSFTTRSGRDVALEIWVQERNLSKCDHAMASLKHAMAWDERCFGREYDLDVYMIVAVDDFNMGAMENKGLNVFNSKYVLADPQTATDEDYEGIESVIAHEYFHNWTGNRITCRDWFQLTLKEGLTVFRDQQFSGDMNSHAVKRIEDVKVLRASQFAEDAGPMAHPIRPDSYIEMNNFYTVTVYNKGAEVIRMLHTLLGEEGFRRGMDLYFERHDGQAVTCDDFVAALADANDRDLRQFKNWYSQEGTPSVECMEDYDAKERRLTLTLSQRSPVNVAPDEYRLRHIPIRIGLLDEAGAAVPWEDVQVTDSQGETVGLQQGVFELTEASQTLQVVGLRAAATASVGRHFSAPVHLEQAGGAARLAFLMAHDQDPFNRWDSGQRLATEEMLSLAAAFDTGEEAVMNPQLEEAWHRVLLDDTLDPAMKSLALELPSTRTAGQAQRVLRPEALHQAQRFMARRLGGVGEDALEEIIAAGEARCYELTGPAIGHRRLVNLAWSLRNLAAPEQVGPRLLERLLSADNMTDAYASLCMLTSLESERLATLRADGLAHFYDRWSNEPLVVDKWFRAQAASSADGALDKILALAEHPAFERKNPNRFRSLVGVFGVGNQRHFNAADGRGYEFVASEVLALDGLNPQTAARVVAAFNGVGRLDPHLVGLVRDQLDRILTHGGLSRDVFEIVSRTWNSAFEPACGDQ